jgi:hypothetical protein
MVALINVPWQNIFFWYFWENILLFYFMFYDIWKTFIILVQRVKIPPPPTHMENK